MENCSIYSHHIWYKEVSETVLNLVEEAQIEITGTQDKWESIIIKGDQNANNRMTLTAKIRETPSYKLGDAEDELTTILNSLRNYFGAISNSDKQLQQKLIAKISSINMEIGVVASKGFNDTFEDVILTITDKLEGIIFSNNNSILDAPNSDNGMFNSDSDVILSNTGYSDIKDLKIRIEDHYYAEMEKEQEEK